MNNDLRDHINTAIREAALKPDTFKAIQDLIEEGDRAQFKIEKLEKAIEGQLADKIKAETEANKQRLAAERIRERADRAEKAELEAAVSKAKADTAMECFRLVFRNAEIRRQVMHDDVVMQSSGDGHSFPVNVRNSETISEEQV
ncbi:MAG: hypothetical protein N4A70_08060 [Pelagimonas sp.]|jgi:hypothetical protein|nr:hypothetical protein [Pelagimonas sp.]